MKKYKKTPEEQLSEVEIGNLPEREFRVVIIKVTQDLGEKMKAQTKKIQEIFRRVTPNWDTDEKKTAGSSLCPA